jgi:hypothetical protein
MKFNLSKLLDLQALITELSVGLKRLNLLDNFEAYETEVTVPSANELKIRHNLPFIPQRYVIVSHLGNGVISRGTSSWTRDFAYIYNYGPDSVTLKIIFYR